MVQFLTAAENAMHVAALKRWQWLIIGVGCGLVLAWFYGEPGPPAGSSRVAVSVFETLLVSPPASDGRALVSGIRVYPPRDGIHLVTFNSAGQSDGGPVLIPHY